MLRCKCGCEKFFAHQRVYLDVYVDSTLQFAGNPNNNIENNIYEAEDPYGPFVCVRCGAEYDNNGTEMKQTSSGMLGKLTDNCCVSCKNPDTDEEFTVTLKKISNGEYTYQINRPEEKRTISGTVLNRVQPIDNIFIDIMLHEPYDYIICDVTPNP